MFTKLRALLGLDDKADVSAITPEQMTAAEATIAQLETTAATATAALDTANAALTTANGKVATLEAWKKEQKATDNREEDDSNLLDEDKSEAKASWEVAANAAIASTKNRLGVK